MSIPYVPQGTTKRFRVPRTLAADFDAFLNRDIPNTVMDFELLHNWYDKESLDYEPTYIRGELYPDATKSRYENTDNLMNIRCSLTSGIRKGDIVIQPNGTIFILDWGVYLESNNAPSRALRCNMMLTIKRFQDAQVDEDGFVVDDDGYVISSSSSNYTNEGSHKIIVPPIPCNAYRYDGRPEDVAVSGTPGSIVNALTEIVVQFNEHTKDIHIRDTFDWGDETYEVIDISRSGLNLEETHGTLRLQAKKKAGGMHDY